MTEMTVTAIQNVRTRQEWAEVISADWRKSIEGIIQTGRHLVLARDELGKLGFAAMVREDLPLSSNTAQRLMQIAKDPKIANASSSTRLPPSWKVLSRLSSLSEDDFEAGIESGLISEKTSQRSADALVGVSKVPKGSAWGENRKLTTLPPPKEARDIARATSRMVAASDGRLYSGSTDEEGAEYTRRREQTYSVIDAIDAIVDSGLTPQDWCAQVKPHWLNRFEYGRIETATKWLDRLRLAFMRQRLVHDCEGEADGE